jgi:hypothetical protein
MNKTRLGIIGADAAELVSSAVLGVPDLVLSLPELLVGSGSPTEVTFSAGRPPSRLRAPATRTDRGNGPFPTRERPVSSRGGQRRPADARLRVAF